MSGSSQLCQKSVKDPYFVQNWVQLCFSLPRSSNEKDIHKRLQTLWGANFTMQKRKEKLVIFKDLLFTPLFLRQNEILLNFKCYVTWDECSQTNPIFCQIKQIKGLFDVAGAG